MSNHYEAGIAFGFQIVWNGGPKVDILHFFLRKTLMHTVDLIVGVGLHMASKQGYPAKVLHLCLHSFQNCIGVHPKAIVVHPPRIVPSMECWSGTLWNPLALNLGNKS